MNLYVIFFSAFICTINCYIRPQETASRQTKSLDGIWKFRLAPEQGLEPKRKEKNSIKDDTTNYNSWLSMPVPSSFNDITQDPNIRDYVGWYWYKQDFYLHETFFNQATSDLYIHFGSVQYHCEIYINDFYIGSHTSGHLPFELQINSIPNLKLNINGKNTVKVFANNILTLNTTIPQGNTYTPENTTNTIYPNNFKITAINFDFFNYAGIHRSVTLLTKPKVYIKKIDFNFIRDENKTVYLNYSIDTKQLTKEFVQLELIDRDDKIVFKTKGSTGKELIEDPKLWWPHTCDPDPGYLYRLNIKILYKTNGSLVDEINIRTGIRFIEIVENMLFINSKRAYLTGFGRHEDIEVKGRGLDLAYIIKDFNLIKWIGANSFRTSHYPYSEELMDIADEYGVLIIDEGFYDSTKEIHKYQLESLINRDKHHPSVIFWSVANEAESQKPESDSYFKEITDFARSLDPTRLITAAINKPYNGDYLSQYLDIIMLNRYVSWYTNAGRLELIKGQILHEFNLFHEKYNKPMMISEYGADTVAGLHQSPSRVFSEDYQVDYLRNHFEAFDELIDRNYFIGEHYWNFQDFMTKSDYTRVLGNKKGLFTRDRQPKASAKIIRCRYSKLAAMLNLQKFQSDYQMFC